MQNAMANQVAEMRKGGGFVILAQTNFAPNLPTNL
jgi:hypothetical protein